MFFKFLTLLLALTLWSSIHKILGYEEKVLLVEKRGISYLRCCYFYSLQTETSTEDKRKQRQRELAGEMNAEARQRLAQSKDTKSEVK